jgi:hypothetical protein
MSRSAPLKLDVISSLTTFGDLLPDLRQRSQLTQRDLLCCVTWVRNARNSSRFIQTTGL